VLQMPAMRTRTSAQPGRSLGKLVFVRFNL